MSKAAKRSLELYRKEAVQAAKDLCYPHKILGLLAIAESENEMKSAGSCIRQDVTGKFFYFKSLNL